MATREFSRCFISRFYRPSAANLPSSASFLFFYLLSLRAFPSLFSWWFLMWFVFTFFHLLFSSCLLYVHDGNVGSSTSFWLFSSIFHYLARYFFAFISALSSLLSSCFPWCCMFYLIILETTWLRTHMLYLLPCTQTPYIIRLLKHSCTDFQIICAYYYFFDALFCSVNISH